MDTPQLLSYSRTAPQATFRTHAHLASSAERLTSLLSLDLSAADCVLLATFVLPTHHNLACVQRDIFVQKPALLPVRAQQARGAMSLASKLNTNATLVQQAMRVPWRLQRQWRACPVRLVRSPSRRRASCAQAASTLRPQARRRAKSAYLATCVSRARPRHSHALLARTQTRHWRICQAWTNASRALLARAARWAHLCRRCACPVRLPRTPSRRRASCAQAASTL